MSAKKLERYWVDISKLLGYAIDIAAQSNTGGIIAKTLAIGGEIHKKDDWGNQLPVIAGIPLVPNPHFIANGCGGSSLKYTAPYITQRRRLRMGTEGFEIIGTVASAAVGSPVNMLAAIKHGAADASSVVHLYHFLNMSRRVRQSEYLTMLLTFLWRIKLTKTVIRSGDLAGALTASMFGKVISMAMRTGKICCKEQSGVIASFIAQELHWRAFVEQQLLGHSGSGPASMMVKELLTRRAHRVLGGQYNWRAIVNEPAGWIVLKDKIGMI